MSTQRNIIANVTGRVWQALMSFVFVPFYIRLMGIEAYGLIGFFTTMLAVLLILDLGLSITVSRELARIGTHDNDRAAARDLLGSLEAIYWAVGAVAALLVLVGAAAIVHRWLNVERLPSRTAIDAVQLMAGCLLLRWPVTLYSGALMGMRQHGRLNAVLALAALLQGGGAVLVLALVSPSVTAFFTWQLVAAAIQVVLLRRVTWRILPLARHRPRLRWAPVRAILGFSAGVTGVAVLSVVLTQLDKFLLSRLLPLETFGYYALAATIAATLTAAAAAIQGAVFPSLARLTSTGNDDQMARLYHQSCQLMSVVLIPAGGALALFAPELLALYLHDPVTAARTHQLLSLFAIGNTLLAMMTLPYALQLAYGWTRLSIAKNVIAVTAYVPLMLIAVNRFGAVGAAGVWVMLNVGYLVGEIPIMHRRLLPGEQWRWYGQDVGTPAVLTAAILGGIRLLVPPGTPALPAVACCVAGAGLAVLASIAALPAMRHEAGRLWQLGRRRPI